MTTTPHAALLTDDEVAQRINLACTNLFDRAGTTSFRIARSIEQAILAKLQATQEPVQAGELPPLPFPNDHNGFGRCPDRYTADQMYAYARSALSARKPLTDGQSKPLPPNIGDYVLATKYSDGDPGDAWALGFYAGNVEDRHLVNDAAGLAIRLGGYRRVGRIPTEIGNWLWANRDNLERAPLKISLWGMYDWAYVNEMLAPGSCGIGLEVKP